MLPQLAQVKNLEDIKSVEADLQKVVELAKETLKPEAFESWSKTSSKTIEKAADAKATMEEKVAQFAKYDADSDGKWTAEDLFNFFKDEFGCGEMKMEEAEALVKDICEEGIDFEAMQKCKIKLCVHAVPALQMVTAPEGPFPADWGPADTKIGFYTPKTPRFDTKMVNINAL